MLRLILSIWPSRLTWDDGGLKFFICAGTTMSSHHTTSRWKYLCTLLVLPWLVRLVVPCTHWQWRDSFYDNVSRLQHKMPDTTWDSTQFCSPLCLPCSTYPSLASFFFMESTRYWLSYTTSWLLRYAMFPDHPTLVWYMEVSNNSRNQWVESLVTLVGDRWDSQFRIEWFHVAGGLDQPVRIDN